MARSLRPSCLALRSASAGRLLLFELTWSGKALRALGASGSLVTQRSVHNAWRLQCHCGQSLDDMSDRKQRPCTPRESSAGPTTLAAPCTNTRWPRSTGPRGVEAGTQSSSSDGSQTDGVLDLYALDNPSKPAPGCECDEISAQCLVQIRDQVVGIFNADRDANKRRRDAQPQPFFFRDVRMGHRRRMRSESLRTAQAHRELDHLEPIQDGKGIGLTSPHFEAERGTRALALSLEDWTIGMALRQESEIPDRRDLGMSTEEGCDLARAFRRGRHSELQGLE